MKRLLLLMIFLPLLYACNEDVDENDDDSLLEKERTLTREVDLISKNAFYSTVPETIMITYFDNEALPYVEISEFIAVYNSIDFEVNLSYDLFDTQMRINQTSSFYTVDTQYSYEMVLDAETDTIEATSAFFAKYDRVKVPNSHFDITHYNRTESDGYSIDLSTYGFSIEAVEGSFYIPFHIAQYFLMHDLVYLYYNHDSVYVFHYHTHEDIFESSLNDTDIPDEIIDASYNYMRLLLDNLYGLNYLDDVSDFDDDLNQFKDMIYDQGTHYQGIRYLLRNLNDIHSHLVYNGIYTNTRVYDMPFPSYLNQSRFSDYTDAHNRLSNYCDNQGDQFSFIIDNTVGHIPLQSFHSETGDLMVELMNWLEPYDELETIVLDLSCNSGGSNQNMLKTLSLLSNDPIHINRVHTLDNTLLEMTIQSQRQNKNYEWIILVSPLTYSASNMFAGIAQDNDLATIMGMTPIGGASHQFVSSTPSGALFTYSAPFHYVSQDLESFEFGIDVDLPMQFSQYNMTYLEHYFK